jgi:hypothetical protein
MKGFVFLTAMAAALATTTTVDAYNGWHWSKAKTENYVITHWSTSDGESITDATCVGYGPVLWSTNHRIRLYARFRCWELDDVNREFRTFVKPLSPYRAKVVEMSCVSSEPEYSCP